MNCYRLLLTAVFCGLIHGAVVAQDVPIYKDPKAPVDARVEDLFKRLTRTRSCRCYKAMISSKAR